MTTYNKLLTRRHRLNTPVAALDERRCSGRTTAIKLGLLADAIREPGRWFSVVDHVDAPDTQHRRRILMGEVKALADTLGLKYIECDATSAAIRSNHFTANPWEIE